MNENLISIQIIKEVRIKFYAMLDELNEMFKHTRWRYFETKKVFFDSELKAYFPDCNFYSCSYGNEEVNDPKFEGMNWDFLKATEAKSLYKSNDFPTRNISTILVSPNETDRYITWINGNNNFRYMSLNSSFDYAEGRMINFPISRMKTNINNLEILFSWITNGLIPADTSYQSDYELFFKLQHLDKIKIVNNELKIEGLEDILGKDSLDKTLQPLLTCAVISLLEKTKIALLNCDKNRIASSSYDEKILHDINRGHWEVDPELNRHILDNENKLVYRNPLLDIKQGGIVGIDFGTKSTVVVYQENSADIFPMRIGTGNLKKDVSAKDYENPTVIEFIDWESFLNDYTQTKGRPHTKWADVTISHTAFSQLLNSSNEDYYAFLNDIKQWCINTDKKMRIKDKKSYTQDLPNFLEITDDMFNPLEIYAYYLGLYINNMRNGIYLKYLLSYPVSYEKEVREKLVTSFERGLKQSLPKEVLENEEAMAKFNVTTNLSEPAGYVISALTEYGFKPKGDEKIFYGVFDFGGGTTDFDFGIYRQANSEQDKRRHHFAIEQFGAQGDRYLGGENLLELLAFHVFKNNESLLREKGICFILPPEQKKFAGSEILLSDSQEAKRNTVSLMNKLRPVWEVEDGYEKIIENNTINLNLYKDTGELETNVELQVDYSELETILVSRIEIGVVNFFESLRFSFMNEKAKDIHKINIFLAGNSSKSPIVKHLFEKYILKETKKINATLNTKGEIFEIFPPLGTEDAYKKMEEMGLSFDKEDMQKPTGKTGVAFGIIKGRPSGKINIINHNDRDDGQAKFQYYVGDCNRDDKFEPVLTPNSDYDTWVQFIDAEINHFELYYTTLPSANTNSLNIYEVTKLNAYIKYSYDNPDISVYIRPVTPHEVEYVVASDVEGEFTIIEPAIKIQFD
ncbi:hypothetical protein AN641_01330 [Candidatus Epulonipiscioides gigas]|nr:hypothetical protein AN641_01330 [Epulopiscium sp. SCG-C07WGA-EpuloA2]